LSPKRGYRFSIRPQPLYRWLAPALLAALLWPVVAPDPTWAASGAGSAVQQQGGQASPEGQPPSGQASASPSQQQPPSGQATQSPPQQPPSQGKSIEDLSPEDLLTQPTYETVKAEWDKQFQPATGVEITIPAASYTASGGIEGLQVVDNFQGRPGQTLLWTKDDGWVEWTFDVPQSGLYEITVDYYPIPGQSGAIQRELSLDGRLPFREASRVVFERVWKDAYWPPQRDNQGNDIRPPQVEAPEWQSKTIEDADGFYDAPFQFALTQGRHTLRLDAVREPMALAAIHVHAPVVIPTYAQRLAEWQAKGYQPVTGNLQIKVQAEQVYRKSDPTIRAEVSYDALADPYANGLQRLNSFGWGRWHTPGQWAEWQVSVPQDGLYEISLDIWQGWSGRRPRIRWLKIDGQVPFQEMQDILFRTGRDWRLETLRENQLPQGKPYLFYLTKGEHVIQMGVTLGFMSETMRVLNEELVEMSELSRQMIMITGPNPDPNMEWDLHEKIPDLLPRLQAIADNLETQARRMDEIGQAKSDASQAFRVVESQVRTMVSHPHDIH